MAIVVALLFGIPFGAPALHAGDYTDKSIHESGKHFYKHRRQGSFTSPFDYGPVSRPDAPAPKAPAGRCNQFTFDATKSFDVDGQKLSVMWDFGDGTTSDKPVVTHAYEKAGDYNVLLTVKDNSGMTCDTNIASTKVSANFPPTAVAGEAKKACVGESVAFSAAGSTASGPATYKWDFGDGTTGEGMTVSHAYDKPGNYRVVLVVDDGKNTECSVATAATSAAIGARPTVTVSGPDKACTGRTVTFDANGTGGPLKYRWDFGDGESWEGGSRASHVYKKGGTYTVSVTADNNQGFSCSVAYSSTTIRVNGTPVADAGENLACCVGKAVTFDASNSSDPDGDLLSYRWDFGDGGSSDEKVTTHTYEKSGDYRVVLTVKDSSGSDCGTSADSFMATVNTTPEAVIQVR